MFIVGANGGRVRQLTPWGAYVEHPTWSPGQPLDHVQHARGERSRRSGPTAAGATRSCPRSMAGGGHKPWFSPDGSRILFMCENQGLLADASESYDEDICVMDADGSDIVNLTNTPAKFENWPSWGPAPGAHHQH